MPKRSVLVLVLVLCTGFMAWGQQPKVKNDPTYNDRPIHFGFTVGLNMMDYSVSNEPFTSRVSGDSLIADVLNPQPGFHVSMISSFKLNQYFTLRFLPGLSFGQRDLYFFNLSDDNSLNHTMQIESSFIEFPCLIKYRAKRVNNFGPFIIGGVNFRYDIAAKRQFAEDSQVYIRPKPFDIYYEFGMGLDFYLPYFRFSTEIKLSAGLSDILDHTPHEEYPQYANAINRLTSNLFMISFHFE